MIDMDLAISLRGRQHLLMNNGAAGILNFRGLTAGLVTRISTSPMTPVGSLYGITPRQRAFRCHPRRLRSPRMVATLFAELTGWLGRAQFVLETYDQWSELAQALRSSVRGDATWCRTDNTSAEADSWHST